MDFEESEKAALVLSKMDLKKNDSPNFFFPTSKQFHETCATQEFPFRMTLMKYVWTNPSSAKVYSKMIQCCKIFFIKNPILVMNNLFYRRNKGWKICDNGDMFDWETEDGEIVEIDNIQQKIWLTGKLSFSSYRYQSNAASDFVSNIDRYDVKTLFFLNQTLSYDDLKFYARGIKECEINCCLVKYENDERVPLEEIIKLFSNCKIFAMNFMHRNHNPCKDYANLVNACSLFERIEFYDFPIAFDVAAFFEQLKMTKSRTLIKFYSCSPDPRFVPIIDEILATETFDYVPPVICYHNTKEVYDKYERMQKIQAREAAKFR